MQKYKVDKKDNVLQTKIDSNKINGYKVLPKNTFHYPMAIESLVLIQSNFIEKVLKKKIQRKLNYYLKYIISLIDETDDGSNYREALNELSKYKDMVEYKYRQFLDDKYINILLKKIGLLEYEIKSKSIQRRPKKVQNIEPEIQLEETHHRRR